MAEEMDDIDNVVNSGANPDNPHARQITVPSPQ